LTVNFKNKQLRLNIITNTNKIFNLTVGRVLSTLNILDKSKKKTNKGERLFFEYLGNFFKNNYKFFGISKISILKIINIKKNSKLSEHIIRFLNLKLIISKIVYDFRIPNNFSKLKKVRSIKKRIKKRIVKNENIFNL
jgi:hypothetical protein